MLTSHVLGVLAVVAFAALWLTVQLAWQRVFPDRLEEAAGGDALAGRIGCHGCDQAEDCERRPEADDLVRSPAEEHET